MLGKRNLKYCWPLVGMALAMPEAAMANEALGKLMADPKNWAAPAGDFANHRYSQLKQINKDNVKNLQVAWTFSTGVLRGHEGGPLIVGTPLGWRARYGEAG